MMQSTSSKLLKITLLSFSYIFLTATSSLDYTRKVEPLPNMPKGNPDPTVGIVVRENSTGLDVLADSSQNIRFSASKNYEKTHIERLSSSSMVDRTPKKFKFVDEQHGFSSDNIYEFSIMFHYQNNRWKYMQFMPFPSVIEWVTEEKLMIYLNNWIKTFEDAGWERVKHRKSNKHPHRQDYYSWKTTEYEAAISITSREPSGYKYYISKAQQKNLKIIPDGYIVFIEITKNSQFQ